MGVLFISAGNRKNFRVVVKMNEQEQHDLLIRLDERTAKILEQTVKTNGRVMELENWRICHEKDAAASAGAKKVKGDLFSKVYSIGEKVVIIIAGVFIGRWLK
jgi:hypothetical protein